MTLCVLTFHLLLNGLSPTYFHDNNLTTTSRTWDRLARHIQVARWLTILWYLMEKIRVLPGHSNGNGIDTQDSHEWHVQIPHLDGLRAIVVTGVVLFHFNFPFFWGGIVGVDMFFTISGFLNTRNITIALSAKKFSLFEVYSRRFFRLYPPSTFPVLITLFVVYITVRPDLASEVFS